MCISSQVLFIGKDDAWAAQLQLESQDGMSVWVVLAAERQQAVLHKPCLLMSASHSYACSSFAVLPAVRHH